MKCDMDMRRGYRDWFPRTTSNRNDIPYSSACCLCMFMLGYFEGFSKHVSRSFSLPYQGKWE